MFTVLIVFAIYYGLIRFLDIPFKNKIKKSKSVEESLRARKVLRIARPVIAVILIVFFCVIVAVISINNGDVDQLSHRIGMIIAIAILEGWVRMRGNVQANSKDEYISKHKDKGFVLYLRAFESDFYSKDPKVSSFEGTLIKAFESNGRDVCAIGMTNELDAPYGAERVYVSDESWQSDVKELMKNANAIIILMSDRRSCIWEIAQSVEMLQKTCFIIESKDKYINVINELNGSVRLPKYEEILQQISDGKEEWEQEERESIEELQEQLDGGSIKLGLMVDENGFKAIKVEDMVVLVETFFDRYDTSGVAAKTVKTDVVKTGLAQKKTKRRLTKAIWMLVALLVIVLVVGFGFKIALPDWLTFVFVLAFGVLFIWKWWIGTKES